MMDWWQLLITIISSSALTAFITGIFNFKTIKETNKENERQRKFDSDSKTVHENKLKAELLEALINDLCEETSAEETYERLLTLGTDIGITDEDLKDWGFNPFEDEEDED